MIPGWFAPENRANLDRLIAEHGVKSVIEIGSFLGLSAVWFAEHEQIERVTCVDRWYEPATVETPNNLVNFLRRWRLPDDFFYLFRENIFASGQVNKIIPIRGDSRDVWSHCMDSDLAYIDGDHSYPGCRADIENFLPKCRIICGDDYEDREGFGVILAVSSLLPKHQHDGKFWWYVK